MRGLRIRWAVFGVLLGTLLGGGTVAASADTGTAAPSQITASAEVNLPDAVTGEAWTAPTFEDVYCMKVQNTVLCTPLDDTQTKENTCFWDVQSTMGSIVVCTTAGQHVSVLEQTGTRLKYNWGCTLAFDACAVMEGTAQAMAANVLNVSARVQDAVSFNTSNLLWTAAIDQWSFWVWAVWIIVLIAGIIAITQASVSGSTADLFGALGRFFLTVPLTQLTLWVTGLVVDALDLLTWELFADADPFGQIGKLMFAGGNPFPMEGVLATAVMLIAMLLMLLVMMLRNLALAALVMVGPLAWMLFPMRSIGKEWVVRYFAALASLLLAGPLMMSLFGFLTSGLGVATSIWDPAIWPFMIGLIVMCFAPFAVFSLFSFVGGSVVDSAAGGAGSRAMGSAQSAAGKIPSPRLGGGSRGGGRSGGGGAPAPRPGGAGGAASRPGGPGGSAPRPGSGSGGSPAGSSRRPSVAPAGAGGGAQPPAPKSPGSPTPAKKK